MKKNTIMMIILACNTITVTSLITLKNYFNLPIIGIIPDINKATKITQNNIIGLLGTQITINHYCVNNLIASCSSKYNIQVLNSNQLVKISEKKIKK